MVSGALVPLSAYFSYLYFPSFNVELEFSSCNDSPLFTYQDVILPCDLDLFPPYSTLCVFAEQMCVFAVATPKWDLHIGMFRKLGAS